MQYTALGRTGLSVSRLCLGTMNFGPRTSEADSFEIMDRALEEGINFFDSANVYGRPIGPGATWLLGLTLPLLLTARSSSSRRCRRYEQWVCRSQKRNHSCRWRD